MVFAEAEPMIKAGTLLVVLLAASAGSASAEDAIAGRIKSAAGTVSVVRHGAVIPAHAGQPLFESDAVRTGGDGRAGIMLRDETRMALGPNTDVRIDQFLYSPGEGRLGMVIKIAQGL